MSAEHELKIGIAHEHASVISAHTPGYDKQKIVGMLKESAELASSLPRTAEELEEPLRAALIRLHEVQAFVKETNRSHSNFLFQQLEDMIQESEDALISFACEVFKINSDRTSATRLNGPTSKKQLLKESPLIKKAETEHSELIQELKDAYQARIKVMKGGGMLYRHAYETIEALEVEVAELRAAKG